MKVVLYVDDDGRKFAMSVPDDCEEADYAYGNPVGPPSLSGLPTKLPLREEVRMHNLLYDMGIFTAKQAHLGRAHIQAAWQRTLAVGTEDIVQLYGAIEERPVILYGSRMERPNTPTQPVATGRRRR